MGTMLQTQDPKGNPDLLTLTHPDAITGIHRAYLEAGADIISTNSFNATAIGLADMGTEGDAGDINIAAARLARAAADEFTARNPSRPRFVSGVMGPTNRMCSVSPDASRPDHRNVLFDPLAAAYRDQASALLDGGVDILMVETVTDTLNAKAALFAIRDLLDERNLDTPVWVSATISGKSGRTLAGQTAEAFWASISHAEPLCVGLNCGLGPEQLQPHLIQLAGVANSMVSIHPNAGLPNASGTYDVSPTEMADALRGFAERGLVNIVGGCCGSTPAHIAAIAEAVKGLAPREVPPPPQHLYLSGLEPLEIAPDTPFVNIGERTNVLGSTRFARLIREGRHEDALDVARQQIKDGAQIIDVNLDDAALDSPAEMTRFLNLIASDPEISRVPVMIDSAQWEVIEAGLKCLQGKGIANSISLKDGEDEFLRRARLIRRYGAAALVMAIDEEGQAESCRRKVDICSRAHVLLTDTAGFPPRNIIFDPNIFAVGTGMEEHADYAVAYIEACRTIKQTLPRCLISGGVSNLSYVFRGNDTVRQAMHAVFLHRAVDAGMDMGIVNVAKLPSYEAIPEELRQAAEDVVLNRRPDAPVRLAKLARRIPSNQRAKQAERKE
jgi:5-methyltetrahydrofolate--homocysteine methyltransferase